MMLKKKEGLSVSHFKSLDQCFLISELHNPAHYLNLAFEKVLGIWIL